MKIKHLLFITLAIGSATVSAQNHKKKVTANIPPLVVSAPTATTATATATATNTLPRPKLVVGIVVDQMRWDYLYRFYERYGDNGFRRLLNEGFSCENTQVDYIPTNTGPGHSCIFTGSVPALHSIAGNDFIDQATGQSIYCAQDTSVRTVGAAGTAGLMSPRNLKTSTITDELKLATNFRSKVIGIALKDRGGIFPAGHSANAAYWFDDKSGNWITSTYYMADLPQWVKDFNDQKMAETYLKTDWNPVYPIDTYIQTLPDASKYEGKFKGTDTTTLPVKTSALYKGNLGLIRSTPFGNTITLDMAVAAINGEHLGENAVTDFLTVSFSSTDYVGHQFGPNSVEIEDTYLKLDRDLGTFLTFLDAKLGKGNYTVFLSADHGAAHNPNFLIDHHIPAGVLDDGVVLKGLNAFLLGKYKVENLVIGLTNYQVNFNYASIKYAKLDEDALIKDCIGYLKDIPGVAYVIDMRKVTEANIPEELKYRIINGYSPEHSGIVQIILNPGWYAGRTPTGTTHGTWNPYDTHIPLVFMGWGIKQGHLNRETHMTDISATIAALLHIQAPNGCIGKPIPEVLK